jgi:hypothetical protein
LLYLTDQRIIFEQKEKTGKFLGLFGGKQTQSLQWAMSLTELAEVHAASAGLFGTQQLLELARRDGTNVSIKLKGTGKAASWVTEVEGLIPAGA